MGRTVIPLFLFIFLLPFQTAFSQKHDVGLWLGVSNYFGDLNTNFDVVHIRPAGGLIARQNISPYWATKFTLSGARIMYDDQFSKYPYQRARNLRFKSYIVELSGQVEFNFFEFIAGDDQAIFSPYLLTGMSVFYFNPRGEGSSSSINLSRLGTEGQGFRNKKYSLIQLAIPYGFGIKYNIGGFWNIGVEVANRKVFSDYLDDVSGQYIDKDLLLVHNGDEAVIMSDLSEPLYRAGNTNSVQVGDVVGKQRGNSVDNDAYLFVAISFTYTIRAFICRPIPN